MYCGNDDLLANLADLDCHLLAILPGEEQQAAIMIADRNGLIARLMETRIPLPALADLQERTRRLHEKFLHLRRTSIMEISFIEQNLRYLSNQTSERAMAGRRTIAVDA